MSLVNTINFLPSTFRTSTNQRFLGATLDQLYTQDSDVQINGYIGRTFAPTYKLKDNYVPDTDALRKNYQLEPSLVVRDDNENVVFSTGYIDLLKEIDNNGGLTNNHQRLFSAETYDFDGHFDYDKFVNYYNYYWLPDGPTSIPIYANQVPNQATFTVERNKTVGGYTFSEVGTHPNLQLTLARGGTYTFNIDQPGFNFWIQTDPGVSGVDPNVSTVSTRGVFGVKNNGTDSGSITFRVPLNTAQEFFTKMPIVTTVTAAVDYHYSDIQGKLLSDFLAHFPDGIDGLNAQLHNKTLIFVSNDQDDFFWTVNSVTVAREDRCNAWRITLVPEGDDYRINLITDTVLTSKQKVFIGSGKTYASNQFWIDNTLRFKQVPVITAAKSYLYYQDSQNPEFYGQIKLVDNSSSTINVPVDILGKNGYTSPNGVKFTNGLKIEFDSSVVPSSYANREFYVEGVGTSIGLVAVDETEVLEDFGAYIDTVPDYITINRSSQDRNPWSRYNRWFHKDVINAAATFHNASANYGPNIPARRPIIEFEPNLQLFNFGKQSKQIIDYITFDSTDAFNDIEGQTTAQVDGVTLATGDRIIFANDYDTTTLNKIYVVNIETINSQHYINLVPSSDSPILPGENVLVRGGVDNASKTFNFDGAEWNLCQTKTAVNQAPLFDIVDADGYSFADTTVYPGSNFAGTRFFGYTPNASSTIDDPILGFPLKYQNFNNVGDISFTNFYDTDLVTTTAGTMNVSTGFLTKNSGLVSVGKYNNWVKSAEHSKQYQLFTKFFDGYVIEVNGVEKAFVQIDLDVGNQTIVPYTKIYLNNKLLTHKTDYEITTYGIYKVVILNTLPEVGDKIDIAIFSEDVSDIAYYEVPLNLDYNPLNESFETIALGQLRTHYNKLIENTAATATNNIPTQDNYLKARGGTLLQHKSPLVYAMTFLNSPSLNFFEGVNSARKEYARFKNKFLNLCSTLSTLNYNDPISGVDTILKTINAVKNSSFSWYYSDMVPQGGDYTSITYTVINARQKNYEIGSIFDKTVLSNRAVLVWVNGVQQTHGVDYTFSNNTPAVIFSRNFEVDDTILIRDYFNTDGNYIPETPTKLGLYPKFTPEIYQDNTYLTPTNVIKGHDGSITPAFGDFRDNYLLELEKRIYNNIKSNYDSNAINLQDIIPGRFRTTGYSKTEYDRIISRFFITWAGENSINYTLNESFDINNPWTWNYGTSPDIIDRTALAGSWRAIYYHWFDTDTPNLTPWEMLGFSSRPLWWVDRYGAAPYTKGNALLWEDLEAGYVWNAGNPYTNTRYARAGLTRFVPVDSAGNLLPPPDIPVSGHVSTNQVGSPFAPGQFGPAEVAWRRSSDYPYAIQELLALTSPTTYFSTQLDTSRFSINSVTGQFSNSENKKINPTNIAVNGDTASVIGSTLRTSGYINWVADSIKSLGKDPVNIINSYFRNLSVQLSYKVGGFTDKNILNVFAEQTTPGSTNASVIVPDTNYDIYLNKSVAVDRLVYSAVIVEKTINGYSVSGYNTVDPFFTIYPSVLDNNTQQINAGGISTTIYNNAEKTAKLIPYGTEYATVQQVADFIISYERYLLSIGFQFTKFDADLQVERNWTLSIRELLHWSQQGWASGTVIILNPVAGAIDLKIDGTIVDEITNTPLGSKLLDQNFLPIKNNAFNIVRTDSPIFGNTFRVSAIDGSNICFASLDLVQFEHVLIIDNVSEFGDIFYVPKLGTRQYRLKLSGSKTGGWTGALSAPGYVYNDPNISQWQSGKDYRLGDLITYNNFYYTANKNIAAAESFDSTQWTQINKSDIKTGLLQSFGRNAQQFDNIYDIDKPLQNETLLSYSAGLIGFRQRPYLTDLGISIPTQTKFYQGYIKEKGSLNSISALTTANFNNVSGNIDINEEWAFRVGTYGGVNSNIYREFILDQSIFTTNPVAIYSTDTYSAGNIIVRLNGNSAAPSNVGNVYSSSNLSSTSTSIYYNRDTSRYMSDMPDVGYINMQDVEYTAFDIDHFTGNLSALGAGDKLWAAKDISRGWNVFRINETEIHGIQITYSLDKYAQIKFDAAHPFVENDAFVLKYFSPVFDGIYRVINVINSTMVTVELDGTALSQVITSERVGKGIVYSLDSARYETVQDFINADVPLHGWLNGEHLWVDRANYNSATAENEWGVYTFNRPWDADLADKITANTVTAGNKFGTGVRIGSNYVYVGNPGNQSVQIFANVNGSYLANVTVSNVNANFGSTLDTSGNILVVGSGSDANVHIYRHEGGTVTKLQTIKSSNVSAVSSVSLSSDLHWLYVGDANSNLVEAYYTTNAAWSNVNYTWANTITGTASTKFGNVVKSNNDGTRLFVSATGATNGYANNGNVYYYVRTANAFALTQTISSQDKNDSALFGYSLDIDATGGNLYVGIPGSTQSGFPTGAVERHVLGLTNMFEYNQTLGQPTNDIGRMGVSVSVSADSKVLAVGSQGSATDERTYFDDYLTVIDSDTTKFVDEIYNSGAVYIFENIIDPLISQDKGKYIFAQELETQVYTGDLFGAAVDITRGMIVAGAPGSSANAGAAHIFVNPLQNTAWTITRRQEPSVDVNSISRTFIYNKKNDNILAALDYIDPAKGKVLYAVDRDIDFKLISDPATYNNGMSTQTDLHWGHAQVGKIWWNLDKVRYINYEQDALIYRLINWGKQFPGSQIEVYEWVESSVLPSQYTGPGMAVYPDDSAYSTSGYVDQGGNVKVNYYFWVKEKNTVNTRAGKHNSVLSIAASIDNPLSQGIPYITVLRDDSVALYNVNHLLTGQSAVLHLGTKTHDPKLIHSEYTLVDEGTGSKLPTNIVNKLIDSLSGIDRDGNVVPDPALPVSQKYGISVRPRQTMVIDKDEALYSVISLINLYLSQYPTVKRKPLTLLNSSEPVPSTDSGEYDLVVETKSELGYVNTNYISAGYKVLVISDESQSTKWAIYEYNGTAFETTPYRVQRYKTNLYWNYINWFDSSYDPTSTPDITVNNNLDLGKLTFTVGQYIKVLDDGDSKFVVYYVNSDLSLSIVGIQDGTIYIPTVSSPPPLETRQILLAAINEIFVDDIADEFNSIFFSMIRFILSEQKNVDWVFKTSFISAVQRIRKLEEFPAYIADNQDFYLDYIKEVKPYRTVIRDFVIDYQRNDNFSGDITDFDLIPYWDGNLQVYRSPTGEQIYDTDLQKTGINSQWYNNYTYGVVDVLIEDGGTGYLFAPQITFVGNGKGAEGYAEVVNGVLTEIVITKPGAGYTEIPNIIINGTGSGARARAVLRNVYNGNNTGHNVVRSIKTNIKFDRVSYKTSNVFVNWDDVTSGQVIAANTVINLNDTLFRLDANNYTVNGTIDFPIGNVTQISAAEFNLANDRITAFNGNVDLGLLVDGISYPGVTVDGNTATVWTPELLVYPDTLITYEGNLYITTGNVFDSGGTFGNISSNVELVDVNSMTKVGIGTDSIIMSSYTDTFGVDPTEIQIDGGAYIDRFESHAPEEMVPGQMLDSLNLTVFSNTSPSSNDYAFRLFDNLTQNHSFYRISDAQTTSLSANLHLTDTVVHVTDASVLPTPNPTLAIPGIVFVNNEKITYYSINTSTNTLGNIRRAVDGTAPANLHATGSTVADASIQQVIPDSTITTANITSTTTYTSTANVSLALHLTGNIMANIGEYIVQKFANTTVAANLRVLGNVTSSNVVPVVKISGTLTTLSGNTMTVHGAASASTITTSTPIGQVYANGNVVVSVTGSDYKLLKQTHAWYTPGGSTPADGTGLINSTTDQAVFLLAQPGYMP
jgi:hypothetical protein